MSRDYVIRIVISAEHDIDAINAAHHLAEECGYEVSLATDKGDIKIDTDGMLL